MTTKLQRLQKALPNIFHPQTNPFIKALIESWANEMDGVELQIDEAKNQIFVTLAEGNYLNQLGKNVGVERPSYVTLDDGTKELIPGLADSEFRQLIPILSFYPKQVKNTIIAALDLFWGKHYTRATVESQIGEPYNLSGTQRLEIEIDKNIEVTITFQNTDFVSPTAATAQEVIDVINRTTDRVTAEIFYNYDLAANCVRIYTNTTGTAGAIQVVGGSANTVLNFPTLLQQFIKVGAYEVNNREIVFKIPENIPLLLDTLKGSHHFKEGSIDFFLTSIVMETGLNYLQSFNVGSLELSQILGGTPGSGTSAFDYPGAIHKDEDYIYICDNNNQRILKKKLEDFTNVAIGSTYGGLDLLMPSGITGDDFYIYITDTGRHEVLKLNKSDLSLDTRYGTEGSGNNELDRPAGIVYYNNKIYICDVQNHRIMVRNSSDLSYSNQVGSYGSGNNNLHSPVDIEADEFGFIYISDYENNRIVKRNAATLTYVNKATVADCAAICYDENTRQLILSDWYLADPEVIRYWDLNLVEKANHNISVGDVGCGALCASPPFASFSATIDPNWPGSFLYNPMATENAFTITSVKTTLQQTILKDHSYLALNVTDTTGFNTSGGYLCIDFGTSDQEQLIPYLGIANTNSLVIHPAYKFLIDHAVDAKVHHVIQGNYIPELDGSDYAVYLINPNIAKYLVKQLVDFVKGAGVLLRFEIDYTHYKYEYLENL